VLSCRPVIIATTSSLRAWSVGMPLTTLIDGLDAVVPRLLWAAVGDRRSGNTDGTPIGGVDARDALISVLLPAPLSPTMAVSSPRLAHIFTPNTTSESRYCSPARRTCVTRIRSRGAVQELDRGTGSRDALWKGRAKKRGRLLTIRTNKKSD